MGIYNYSMQVGGRDYHFCDTLYKGFSKTSILMWQNWMTLLMDDACCKLNFWLYTHYLIYLIIKNELCKKSCLLLYLEFPHGNKLTIFTRQSFHVLKGKQKLLSAYHMTDLRWPTRYQRWLTLDDRPNFVKMTDQTL